MEEINNFQEALDYVYSYIDYSLTRNLRYSPEKFDLNRMKKLMASLGNPQKQYKVIHVAGTKGKGSISAMVASILQEAKFSVGFYSSPHMIDFRERIRIGNQLISEKTFVSYVYRLRHIFERIEKISTFEIITAIAFQYFYDMEVDFAVVEVGMGGRLDATNVVNPLLSVISPISLDHTKILGKTIPKIAKEKAGIIKKGVPVVISNQTKPAKEIILKTANKLGSELIDSSTEFRYEQNKYSLKNQTFMIYKGKSFSSQINCIRIKTPLLGDHQIQNAVTAYASILEIRDLGYKIQKRDIQHGFKHVKWPGRFEVIKKEPTVIIDGAHNTDSFQKLSQTIRKYLPQKRITLIFGASEDKEVKLMLEIVKPYVSRFIFTQSNHPRAMDAKIISEFASDLGINNALLKEIEDVKKLIESSVHSKEVFIATGSIFIAGAIKQKISD